jgi:hypothetical protein
MSMIGRAHNIRKDNGRILDQSHGHLLLQPFELQIERTGSLGLLTVLVNAQITHSV